MRFERTRRTMEVLEGKTITAQDLLGIFSDLCKDAETPEMLPLGDVGDLVIKMCSLRRMLDRIYRNHMDEFSDQDYQNRLEKLRASVKANEVSQERLEKLDREEKALKESRQRLLEYRKRYERLQEEKAFICGEEEKVIAQETKLRNELAFNQRLLEETLEKKAIALEQAELFGKRLTEAWNACRNDKVLSENWQEARENIQRMEQDLDEQVSRIQRELNRFRKTYRSLAEKLSTT